MPETPSDAFVRTTLVHEDKKADLLLPSNLPVAELLPSIARRFLTVTPRRAIQGFVLTMSNGATIDPGLTFAAQGVKNGTLLILGPRVRETEKKYDDVIEAVADVVNESNKPWTESDAAGVASGAAATLLVAATLLLSQARPTAGVVVPVILGCLAALLFGIVWVLERGERHSHAVAMGLVACVLLAACGWTGPAHGGFALPLALAGIGGAIGAAIALPLLSEWKEMMLAPGLAGVVLGTVGTVNTFLEGSSDRVAVVTASLLGIVLLLLPQLSLRMSRLESADPLLSPGPESQGKTRSIDAGYVKRNYLHGRRAMFSVRCGAGFALAVLTPSTVATGKWGVVVLGGILVILTLGSRAHYAHMDVVSEYVIAVSIFALGCLAVMVTQPSWWLGLVIVLALLAGALIAFGLVLGSTPQWMRQAADVGETIAGIILVPAAVLALRLW